MNRLSHRTTHRVLGLLAVLHSVAIFLSLAARPVFGPDQWLDAIRWFDPVWFGFATLWFLWPIVLLLHRGRSAWGMFVPLILSLMVMVLWFQMYRWQLAVFTDPSVILTPDQAREVIHRGEQKPEPKLTGYWMPTARDVRELDKRLPAFIRQHTRIRRPILRDVRQYAGFEAGTKRFIFVNGFYLWDDDFWRDGGVGWKTRPVVWGGGGNWVWWVEYDLETKEFERFATGGPL